MREHRRRLRRHRGAPAGAAQNGTLPISGPGCYVGPMTTRARTTANHRPVRRWSLRLAPHGTLRTPVLPARSSRCARPGYRLAASLPVPDERRFRQAAPRPVRGCGHPRLRQDPVPAAHGLPHAGRPARQGAGAAGALGRHRPLRAAAGAERGPPEVRAARRAALRQRQHPHRPRAEQDPQGPRHQVAADAGARLELRAGLGLPRPADRVEDRGGIPRQGPQQGRRAGGGVPPPVPRLRAGLARRAARGVQAPRHRRRLGPPLRHHGVRRRSARSPARS